MLDISRRSFWKRDIEYTSEKIEDIDGEMQLINLDTVWYGLVKKDGVSSIRIID